MIRFKLFRLNNFINDGLVQNIGNLKSREIMIRDTKSNKG